MKIKPNVFAMWIKTAYCLPDLFGDNLSESVLLKKVAK